MKSDQLQSIRREILDQLYAVRPDALAAKRILKNMRREGGFDDVTEGDVVRECAYLIEKKLVQEDRDPVAVAQVRYKLTADGTEHVEMELG